MNKPPVATLAEVVAFLDGSATLEGVWFGGRHPDHEGRFWWRTRLRAALAAASFDTVQTTAAVPLRLCTELVHFLRSVGGSARVGFSKAFADKLQAALITASAVDAAAVQEPVKDRLLKALERALAAETALRRLVDECDNDKVPGWEARMGGCIDHANALLAATPQPAASAASTSSADVLDAARYQFLRSKRETLLVTGFFGNGCINRTVEDVDAAIDAALAAQSKGAQG